MMFLLGFLRPPFRGAQGTTPLSYRSTKFGHEVGNDFSLKPILKSVFTWTSVTVRPQNV